MIHNRPENTLDYFTLSPNLPVNNTHTKLCDILSLIVTLNSCLFAIPSSADVDGKGYGRCGSTPVLLR
jgi:hypothetical protein